jgi:hypothetical protein
VRSCPYWRRPESGLPGWLKDIFVPVLVALVALAGTGIGAYLANKSAQDTQRAQLQDEQRKEDRDMRAETYTVFMDEAFAYAGILNDGVATCVSTSYPASLPAREAAKQTCTFDVYLRNISAFRKMASAYFAVRIYGTGAGSEAASDVYDTFPHGESREKMSPKVLDVEILSDRLSVFLDVACRELPNTPRPGCS